jgi:hypothetical protein
MLSERYSGELTEKRHFNKTFWTLYEHNILQEVYQKLKILSTNTSHSTTNFSLELIPPHSPQNEREQMIFFRGFARMMKFFMQL